MDNYFIKTPDGNFGSKRNDNGDVIMKTSGWYSRYKPDNVALTNGKTLIVEFPKGSTVLIENGKLTVTCPE